MLAICSRIERLTAESHRSRLDFLRTELDSCFTFISVAETAFRSGDHERAERALAHAEGGYATAVMFMSDPKYAHYLDEEEARELRARLKRLRSMLDDLRRAK